MPFEITVLYNNVADDPRLDAAWGFSCLIEGNGGRVLFDAGGDGAVLMANVRTLGLDLRGVKALVLSHDHWDHMGGLWDALRATGPVDLFHPGSQSDIFQAHARRLGARPVVATTPVAILPGLTILPEMGEKIREQALVLEGSAGLTLLTGCAHPGVAEMVLRCRSLRAEPVEMVLGGFHLFKHKPNEVEAVAAALRVLGVRRVAPSHCTGEPAVEAFARAWGGGFLRMGCGTRVSVA